MVLIFTVHDDRAVREILTLGARGFVLISDASTELVQAVAALGEHRTFFAAHLSKAMLHSYIARPICQSQRRRAACEAGLLAISLPVWARPACSGLLTLFGSYHEFDYQLFYMSVRQNANDRVVPPFWRTLRHRERECACLDVTQPFVGVPFSDKLRNCALAIGQHVAAACPWSFRCVKKGKDATPAAV